MPKQWCLNHPTGHVQCNLWRSSHTSARQTRQCHARGQDVRANSANEAGHRQPREVQPLGGWICLSDGEERRSGGRSQLTPSRPGHSVYLRGRSRRKMNRKSHFGSKAVRGCFNAPCGHPFLSPNAYYVFDCGGA